MSGRPPRFTPAEDAAILAGAATFRAVARALGRSRSGVMARHAVLTEAARRAARWTPPPGGRRDRWLPAHLDYLRVHWGVRPDAAVAAALGRSVAALRQRAWRIGLRRRANATHLAAVARVFGVGQSAAQKWVERGWLRAGRRPVRQGAGWLWDAPPDALRRFVREHGHPHDLARMAPGHWLTAYAGEVWAGEWLTLPAAAARVHFAPQTLQGWLARGVFAPGEVARGRGRRAHPAVIQRAAVEAWAAAQHESWRRTLAAAVRRWHAARAAAAA